MKEKSSVITWVVLTGVLLGVGIVTFCVLKGVAFWMTVAVAVLAVLLWAVIGMQVVRRLSLASDKSLSLLLYRAAKLKTRKEDTTLLEKAMVQKCEGHPEAWLGYRMLGELFSVRGDRAKAWDYFIKCEQVLPAPASDADRAAIWNDLGNAALATGRPTEAQDYFMKASKVDPGYLRGAGLMWAFGWGVERDTAKAFDYLQKATRMCCDMAISNLYELKWRMSHDVSHVTIDGYCEYMNCCHCGKGVMAGLQPLRESALQGYAPAQFEMGTLYQSGRMRVDARTLKREAFRWYNAAARQGYLPALHNLGFLAQQFMVNPVTGTICEPKVKGSALYDMEDIRLCSMEGHKLILRAAEAGYVLSQHSIGMRYLIGGQDLAWGLDESLFKIDRTEAWHWLTEAADQGLSAAKVDLKKYFGEEY